MSNHDCASSIHHLRGLATNLRPGDLAPTADDVAMLRAEGRTDAEIRLAFALIHVPLKQAEAILVAALTKRADEIEGLVQ